VVKNLLLTPEKTFRRKIQEIILARRVEDALSKKEIMALYLNQIYFGQGRYGVVEAARYYFHKELKDLNEGEMAYLGGLPQAPEAISGSSKRGGARLQYVLNQLLANGKIDLATAEKYKDMPVPPYDDAKREPIAPEVVDLVKADLEKRYGAKDLDTMGGEVRVTVRPDMQQLARAALQKKLRAYDAKHGIGAPSRKVAAAKIDDEIAKLGKKLGKGGPKNGGIYPSVVTAVDDAGSAMTVDLGAGPVTMALGADERLNPDKKKPSQRFAPGDVVDVVWGDALKFPSGPEGAVVIIDVKTRDVLALVGGFHVHPGEFNRAVQAKRQAGSTFKPILYAAAIGAKKYTPASIVNDAPDVIGSYKPKDYGNTFQGAVRLRYALAESINTVAVRMCFELGPPVVAAMAHAMGITSDLPDGDADLSVALGSGEVSPLELTNAFATFAAGGKAQPPRIVESINGEVEPPGDVSQAMTPETAYVITDMMRSVLEPGGTGAGAAKDLKVPAVGKTGTSNDKNHHERDAWFMGLTPEYAVGVWVGYDDNRPLGAKQTGGALALPVFVDVINKIGSKGRHFERPAGVVVVKIDKATGLLAPEGAPADSTLEEVFLDGTQPTEVAPTAGEVDTTTFVTDEYGDSDPATPPPDAADSGDDDDAQPVSHP
jgi:penicillin-binding protein 1A